MAEFGESIMYIPLRGDVADIRRAKINLEPRFADGVFLGLADRSDEIIVWGKEGIRRLAQFAGALEKRCGGKTNYSVSEAHP